MRKKCYNLQRPIFRVLFQNIIQRNVVDIVNDLTVPEELVAEARKEADTLPKLEITKLDLQWLQVQCWVPPNDNKVENDVLIE